MTETTTPEIGKITLRRACEILQISKSTAKRRIASGQYGRGTSIGRQSKPGENTRLFTFADFGLPEGALPTQPEPDEDDAPTEPELPYQDEHDEIASVVHAAPAPKLVENDFASRYRRGEVGDSTGTKIDGTNLQYSKPVTLLGPVDEGHRQLDQDSQGHLSSVNDATLRPQMIGIDGLPVEHAGSDTHPLNTAFNTSEYKLRHRAAVAKFERRYGRGHSQAEQRAASERATQSIKAAFPKP